MRTRKWQRPEWANEQNRRPNYQTNVRSPPSGFLCKSPQILTSLHSPTFLFIYVFFWFEEGDLSFSSFTLFRFFLLKKKNRCKVDQIVCKLHKKSKSGPCIQLMEF